MSELDKYIEAKERNYFWKLSCGEHENLLNLALELAEENNKNLKQALRVIYKGSLRLDGYEKTINSLVDLALEATQDLSLFGNDEYDYDKIGVYHKKIEELTV